MRDRKFRGISIYGAMIYGTGYTDFLNIYPERKGLWLWSSYSWLEVEPETLAEFTGLLDKNGVEIYEGDILKSFHFSGFTEDAYLFHFVKWSDKFNGWFATNCSSMDDGDGSIQMFVYMKHRDDCEVIGNIYQHPELLKEKENV